MKFDCWYPLTGAIYDVTAAMLVFHKEVEGVMVYETHNLGTEL